MNRDDDLEQPFTDEAQSGNVDVALCPETRIKRFYQAYQQGRLQFIDFDHQGSTFSLAVDPEDPCPPTEEEKCKAAEGYSYAAAIVRGSGITDTKRSFAPAANLYGRLLSAARTGFLGAINPMGLVLISQLHLPHTLKIGRTRYLLTRLGQDFYTDNGECTKFLERSACFGQMGVTYSFRGFFLCERCPPEVKMLLAEFRILALLYHLGNANSINEKSEGLKHYNEQSQLFDEVLGPFKLAHCGLVCFWIFGILIGIAILMAIT